MARKSKRSSMKKNRKSLKNVLLKRNTRSPKLSIQKNINPVWLTEQYRQGNITEKEFMQKCKNKNSLEFRNNELICNIKNENSNKQPLPISENQFTFQNPTPEKFIQYLITPEKLFDGMTQSMSILKNINKNDKKIKTIELQYQILQLQQKIHQDKYNINRNKYTSLITELMPAVMYMDESNTIINQQLSRISQGKYEMEQAKFIIELETLNAQKKLLNNQNYQLYNSLIETIATETKLPSGKIVGGSIQFSPIENAQQLVDFYAKIIENKIKRKNQRREILGLATTTVDKIIMILEENYNFSKLKGEKRDVPLELGETAQQLSSLTNINITGGKNLRKLSRKSRKLSRKSRRPSNKSRKVSRKMRKSRKSRKLSRKSRKLSRKSRKVSRKMRKLSRKSRKVSRKMRKLSRKSRKVSRKSRKVSKKLSRKSRKVSRKLSRKSRKVSRKMRKSRMLRGGRMLMRSRRR
jgi:hypothetical protein